MRHFAEGPSPSRPIFAQSYAASSLVLINMFLLTLTIQFSSKKFRPRFIVPSRNRQEGLVGILMLVRCGGRRNAYDGAAEQANPLAQGQFHMSRDAVGLPER